nr:MAG TPA: hypothetical protein [Caudoviricetes sp.]
MDNITPTKRFLSFLYSILAVLVKQSLAILTLFLVVFYTDAYMWVKSFVFLFVLVSVQIDITEVFNTYYNKED